MQPNSYAKGYLHIPFNTYIIHTFNVAKILFHFQLRTVCITKADNFVYGKVPSVAIHTGN